MKFLPNTILLILVGFCIASEAQDQLEGKFTLEELDDVDLRKIRAIQPRKKFIPMPLICRKDGSSCINPKDYVTFKWRDARFAREFCNSLNKTTTKKPTAGCCFPKATTPSRLTLYTRPTRRTNPGSNQGTRPNHRLRPNPNRQTTSRPRPSPSPRPNRLPFPHLLSSEEEEKYCNTTRCGKDHIICPKSGISPEPGCITAGPYHDMEDLKDMIVDYHNELRNKVAGGGLKGIPSAARMATMQWDHNLHVTATYQANFCTTRHDVCYSTEQFDEPGQNFGWITYTGSVDRLPLSNVAKDSLKSWARRSADVDETILRSFPALDSRGIVPNYGLFTVMVNEENDRVGCGINRFNASANSYKVIFTCHYANNNFIGHPTYKAGAPASRCNTGRNPKYPNLCSDREEYVDILQI